MAKPIGSLLAAFVLGGGIVLGSDVWAFRFDSLSPSISTSWHDDLVFHNTTGEVAVVRLIGVSNGGIQEGDLAQVSIASGRTVSLRDLFGAWQAPDSPLWVVHVDVPDGVLVFSRGGADGECPSPCTIPSNPFPNLGAFSMPVFRSLAPAGQAQIHMGADLGLEPSRTNVGIYNAGSVAATATIALFQACDDSVLETRTISIPADTAAQGGGLGSTPTHCAPITPLNTWLRYATVTVDQPSLSYIVNLADPLPLFPLILLSVPIGN